MKPIPGARPATAAELVRAQDRMTFVYLERCKVHRSDNAITATDERGVTYFPAAAVAALMLGPGTDITHQAVAVLADSGSTVVWVGEHGVRCYAAGRSVSRTARLLVRQAELVSNQNKRLAAARLMYGMRFPDEASQGLTMHQLRGREGARVRKIYHQESIRTGVEWTGRQYRPDEIEESNEINQAITAATQCLYGLCHAVVLGLGCSPGLGVVHTGHDLSFVYDIADLYKMSIAVPVAFDVAASQSDDVMADARLAMRDQFRERQLLKQVVKDVYAVLGADELDDEQWDVAYLWDGAGRTVEAGANWGDHSEDFPW